MLSLISFLTWFLLVGLSVYHRLSLKVSTLLSIISLFILWYVGWLSFLTIFFLGIITLGIAIPFLHGPTRRNYLTHPLLKQLKHSLPKMSSTERIALEAGTVWWDAELFTGNPQWEKLLNVSKPELSAEEKAFIDGPVETLCHMVNDWEITHERKDLNPKIWQFLKENRFFGLIIPKQYGGLEFSAFAHSEILAKLSGVSITATTTVSVPNSLGPAELLLHYGTDAQKDYYLPRLAKGEEIPCFALTNPEAGSDATAIPDTGIVCKGKFEGKEILGMRLTWNKRYITLAPVATVLGLAFKLHDPNHLLGDKENLGITCALIPTSTEGVKIGDRHLPLNAPFQNGPTQGKDVFIPLDWIIGGKEMIGQGWRMLVECLSTGRAISLPSCAAGGAKAALATSGAYARIRKQFKQPIGLFEGIEEPLARMANEVYASESARQLTAWAIDQGEKPSVLGAILKSEITERGRKVSQDAMDIHGGKAVMMGPTNYLANGYINAPIGVTVEGANILTRNLIIFGQGAIRCHPFIKQEMDILKGESNGNELNQFDSILRKHLAHTISNAIRSFFMAMTKGYFIHKPSTGRSSRYYQCLTWGSSAFAFIADCCLLIYGGKLKTKEKISARLGDLLSMLYLGSASLKRFEDEGRPIEDEPLIDWVLQDKWEIFWKRINEILQNMPNRWMAFGLRCILMPLGNPAKRPNDYLDHRVAQLFQTQSGTRNRLIKGMFLPNEGNHPFRKLEQALKSVLAAEPILARLERAKKDKVIRGVEVTSLIEAGLKASLITEVEAKIVREAEASRTEIIQVDHFSKGSLEKTNR